MSDRSTTPMPTDPRGPEGKDWTLPGEEHLTPEIRAVRAAIRAAIWDTNRATPWPSEYDAGVQAYLAARAPSGSPESTVEETVRDALADCINAEGPEQEEAAVQRLVAFVESRVFNAGEFNNLLREVVALRERLEAYERVAFAPAGDAITDDGRVPILGTPESTQGGGSASTPSPVIGPSGLARLADDIDHEVALLRQMEVNRANMRTTADRLELYAFALRLELYTDL